MILQRSYRIWSRWVHALFKTPMSFWGYPVKTDEKAVVNHQ